MLKHKKFTLGALAATIIAAALITAAPTHAKSIYVSPWQTLYPASDSLNNATPDGCQLCHATAAGIGRNPYGSDLDSYMNLGITDALQAIEDFDSDGDPTGSSNIVEINANTQPGWVEGENPSGVIGLLDPASIVECVASVDPASLDFGDIMVGDTASLMTTVSNEGGLACTVTASVSGDEFTLASASAFSVAANSTAEVNVEYTPILGASTGNLALQIVEQGDISVSLSGSGVEAPVYVLDLDIKSFRVTKKIALSRVKDVVIKLTVNNGGLVEGSAPATVTGEQNGEVVHTQTLNVTDAVGNGSSKYTLDPFTPTAVGEILWTMVIADGDPDDDVATATTTVNP